MRIKLKKTCKLTLIEQWLELSQHLRYQFEIQPGFFLQDTFWKQHFPFLSLQNQLSQEILAGNWNYLRTNTRKSIRSKLHGQFSISDLTCVRLSDSTNLIYRGYHITVVTVDKLYNKYTEMHSNRITTSETRKKKKKNEKRGQL